MCYPFQYLGWPCGSIFNITAGTVTLASLTIANGADQTNGSGIYNAAKLTLRNCTFTWYPNAVPYSYTNVFAGSALSAVFTIAASCAPSSNGTSRSIPARVTARYSRPVSK